MVRPLVELEQRPVGIVVSEGCAAWLSIRNAQHEARHAFQDSRWLYGSSSSRLSGSMATIYLRIATLSREQTWRRVRYLAVDQHPVLQQAVLPPRLILYPFVASLLLCTFVASAWRRHAPQKHLVAKALVACYESQHTRCVLELENFVKPHTYECL